MGCRIFSAVNNITAVNIGIYEDENIQDSNKLEKVLKSDVFDVVHNDTAKQIRALFEEALKRKTGVFCYL